MATEYFDGKEVKCYDEVAPFTQEDWDALEAYVASYYPLPGDMVSIGSVRLGLKGWQVLVFVPVEPEGEHFMGYINDKPILVG